MSINARAISLYEIRNSTDADARRRRDREQFINNGLVALRDLSLLPANAVMGLTRSAALDYAKQGIRINAVNPGPIATDLMARSADQGITFDDLGSMVPMGRSVRQRKLLKLCFSALMLLATLRDNP